MRVISPHTARGVVAEAPVGLDSFAHHSCVLLCFLVGFQR